MNKEKKFKRMTEKEYINLKILLGMDGLKVSDIHGLTGRSKSTLTKIKRSNSLEEYIAMCNMYNKKKTTPMTEVVSGAKHQTEDIIVLLNNVMHNQEEIYSLMHAMLDELKEEK